MQRLPVAPPPRQDEALSSWIARVAARYDVSPYDLIRHLIPAEAGYADLYRLIDSRAAGPLETALAEVTGQSKAEFAGRRLAGLTGDPGAAWLRRMPAWCPVCVAQDVVESGEVHFRREWRFGGYLICPKHGRLLSTACPRCLLPAICRPVDGRLRLWCPRCSACVDTMAELGAISRWPPRSQLPTWRCRTVSVSAAARPLLLRVQADLLALLAGKRPRAAWTRALKRDRALAIVRDFSFVMLGPLGEAQLRAVSRRNGKPIEGPPPEDWHPGALPPEIAAPAILACATFLAHESGAGSSAVRWDRRMLSNGEGTRLDAETLLWHLTSREGETLRDMFARPLVTPFSSLLAALQADQEYVAAGHEASRRRWKMRGRLQKTSAGATAPGTSGVGWAPSLPRCALNRSNAATPVSSEPKQHSARAEAASAVHMAYHTDPADDARGLARFEGTLFANRYIHYWLLRHRHLPPERLIDILAGAVKTARARERGVVLPEIAPCDAASIRISSDRIS